MTKIVVLVIFTSMSPVNGTRPTPIDKTIDCVSVKPRPYEFLTVVSAAITVDVTTLRLRSQPRQHGKRERICLTL